MQFLLAAPGALAPSIAASSSSEARLPADLPGFHSLTSASCVKAAAVSLPAPRFASHWCRLTGKVGLSWQDGSAGNVSPQRRMGGGKRAGVPGKAAHAMGADDVRQRMLRDRDSRTRPLAHWARPISLLPRLSECISLQLPVGGWTIRRDDGARKRQSELELGWHGHRPPLRVTPNSPALVSPISCSS